MFKQVKRVYQFKKSGCPYENCVAAAPGVRDVIPAYITPDIKAKAHGQPIRLCRYCGGAWYEEMTPSLRKMYVLIGYPEQVPQPPSN